jgi:hypothetical protein
MVEAAPVPLQEPSSFFDGRRKEFVKNCWIK